MDELGCKHGAAIASTRNSIQPPVTSRHRLDLIEASASSSG